MSVDTKLFVATKKENILTLLPKLIEDLNVWQREKLDKVVAESEYHNRLQFLFNGGRDNWSNGVSLTTSRILTFHINFQVNGEKRNLFVTHTCSSDYKDTYEGDKIIFSLSCWGSSAEIMQVVGKSVAEYGKVFYDYNDCDEIGFEELKF